MSDNTILDLLAKRVQNSTDAVFISDETRKLTAAEFDELSDTIAQTWVKYIWKQPTAQNAFTINSVFPIYRVL